MIALVLSSVVILLVSGTFLAQSQHYSAQLGNVSVHDNARVATERLAAELRSAMQDGVTVAGPRTLTVRSPIVLSMVCDRAGDVVRVYMDGGAATLNADEVAGVALRDPSTGTWAYRTTTWSYIDGGATAAASACATNGADTAWAADEFQQLEQLHTLYAGPPNPGDVIMLFRESTFKIRPSTLETSTLGLFRQAYGGALVEFATGMDTTAQFQYRTGGTTYADTVAGAAVGDIDAVRIVAEARLPTRSGTLRDATFGWSVNIALRNVQ